MCLDKSDIDSVLKLMITHWNMYEPKKPNLVITVIGGAKNFRLDGKKKEIFNRGLIEVNQSVRFDCTVRVEPMRNDMKSESSHIVSR